MWRLVAGRIQSGTGRTQVREPAAGMGPTQRYKALSSTLFEIDPHTAYVVCISTCSRVRSARRPLTSLGTSAWPDRVTTQYSYFIQYIARNWPWYSLRGLHIRITWFSLYGIRIPLFSLYGIHMPVSPYMEIQPIVLGVALLWAAMDSPLSQRPLLWCHNDMTVIFRGIRVDVRETPDNALNTRFHGDYKFSIHRFFVEFNAICYTFRRKNLIYIEGRNCR